MMRALRIVCLSGMVATSRPAVFLGLWAVCELFHALAHVLGVVQSDD